MLLLLVQQLVQCLQLSCCQLASSKHGSRHLERIHTKVLTTLFAPLEKQKEFEVNENQMIFLISGLFAGGVPSILRDAPFSGFYFLFYSQLQNQFHSYFTPNDSRPGTIVNLMAGAVAATIATIATHPQDLVKTRMQIATTQNTTMMQVFGAIWKVREK